MYKELGTFFGKTLKQKQVWSDGDLWTAVIGSGLFRWWAVGDATLVQSICRHLPELITVLGIVFGFVLATLTTYVTASSAWRKDGKTKEAADKLIDWHVLTIVVLLLLLAYAIGLWVVTSRGVLNADRLATAYAILVFLALYGAGQILNHVLTLWWFYYRRESFEKD